MRPAPWPFWPGAHHLRRQPPWRAHRLVAQAITPLSGGGTPCCGRHCQRASPPPHLPLLGLYPGHPALRPCHSFDSQSAELHCPNEALLKLLTLIVRAPTNTSRALLLTLQNAAEQHLGVPGLALPCQLALAALATCWRATLGTKRCDILCPAAPTETSRHLPTHAFCVRGILPACQLPMCARDSACCGAPYLWLLPHVRRSRTLHVAPLAL